MKTENNQTTIRASMNIEWKDHLPTHTVSLSESFVSQSKIAENPELTKHQSSSFEDPLPSTTANSSSWSANREMNIKKKPKEICRFKSTEIIQMLPSTPKIYRDTKWISFQRRMEFIDRPLVCICFEGLIGDFYKKIFFKDASPNEDITFLLWAEIVRGLQNFYNNF